MKQFILKTRMTAIATACIYSVGATMLLASCTQDELPGTGTAVGIAPLHIASAGLQAPGMQAVTRAADALTTGSIGVFRSQGTGYAETQDNKQYTYTAAKGWQPSAAADTVYLMANDVDVCAYFPYKSTYTDKTAIPLASGKYTGTVDDLTKHDPADICYATNRTLNGASVSTDFEMQHAMAMVQLSFSRLNYEGTACNLTSVIIKNTELIGTATLNITDGTYAAPVKVAVKWTPGTATPATGIQVPATGISETTTALLVPCTLDAAGSTTFTFTVDGQAMSVKVPSAKLPTFEAGKIHRLKFVIHAASVTLSDVIHVFIELRLSSAYLCQHVPFHYRYRSNLQFAGFQFEVDVVLLARFELIAGKFLFGYFHLHLLPVHGQCQGDVARQGGGKQQQVVRNGSSGCIQGLCRHSRGKPGGRAVCIRRCFKRLVGGAFVYFVSFQR